MESDPNLIEVMAKVEKKIFIELQLSSGTPFYKQVGSKDFVEFLKKHPTIASNISVVLTYRFFEKLTVQVSMDGRTIDTVSEPINIGPRRVLQNRGQMLSLADLNDPRDPFIGRLRDTLIEQGADHFFTDGAGIFIPMNKNQDDRLLTDEEMAAVNAVVTEFRNAERVEKANSENRIAVIELPKSDRPKIDYSNAFNATDPDEDTFIIN